MRVFKDDAGRDWCIDLTFIAARRAKDQAGVDVLSVSGSDAFAWADNTLDTCNIIAAILEPEIEKRKLTLDVFALGLRGDAIDRARKSLLEEIVNFTPNPNRRRIVQELITLALDSQEKRLSDQVKALDAIRVSTPGNGAINSPEQSGSAPTV